jgi:hypothetical protein
MKDHGYFNAERKRRLLAEQEQQRREQERQAEIERQRELMRLKPFGLPGGDK